MISLQDVTKQYPDGTVAVHDLTLEVDEGVICALVGPSGEEISALLGTRLPTKKAAKMSNRAKGNRSEG